MAGRNRKVMTYRGTELVKVESERDGKRTWERAVAFCAALAETANVGRACKAVGMSRSHIYDWREEDPAFAAAWDRAEKVGVTALEDEAKRRAFEGVDEPLTHQGQITYELEPLLDDDGLPVCDNRGEVVMVPRRDAEGRPIPITVKKYSDGLVVALLKAHAPEKYRERVEMRHEAGESLADALRAARERTGK